MKHADIGDIYTDKGESRLLPYATIYNQKSIRTRCDFDPDYCIVDYGTDINEFSKKVSYTTDPYPKYVDNWVDYMWVERHGVDGWYSQAMDEIYNMYPTRESWITVWDHNVLLEERGYDIREPEETDHSDTEEVLSPLKEDQSLTIGKGKNIRFICPYCNMDFPSKQKLNKHIRISDHEEYY